MKELVSVSSFARLEYLWCLLVIGAIFVIPCECAVLSKRWGYLDGNGDYHEI
jgi:hypothetical protein